jgi:hypothetical protein
MFVHATKSAQPKQSSDKPRQTTQALVGRGPIIPPSATSVAQGVKSCEASPSCGRPFHFEDVPLFSSEEKSGDCSGMPLDWSLRKSMESRLGHDFSKVRVHTDEFAGKSAKTLNAAAYTVGSDVFFNAGRYAPSTSDGLRLIAHELTHVAQQGTEAANLFRSGGWVPSVDPSKSLEHEAEVISSGVATGRRTKMNISHGAAVSVQCQRQGPSPTPPEFLGRYGANAVHVTGGIWDVHLPTLGQTWVGPYDELSAFLSRTPHRGQMQAAHIVGGEHLGDISSMVPYEKAPCVAVDATLHATWTAQTANLQSQKGTMGGRATKRYSRPSVSREAVIHLYDEVYKGHPELRSMARQIINRAYLPNPSPAMPKPASPMDAHKGTKLTTDPSPMDAHQGTKLPTRISPMDAHKGTKLPTRTSPMDAHRPGGASPMDAHQGTKLPSGTHPMDAHKPELPARTSPMGEHQTPEIGAKGGRPAALTGGGPIEAFNKLMTVIWVVDMLQVIFGSGSFEQKAVTVGKSVAIGTLSGAALKTLVGSELAGPVGFLLSLRSDSAQFNREQEINELIDEQTDELMEKLGNWTDSHPPPAQNPWGVHGRKEARQYIIDKLVAEQEQKLNEAKRKAQEKAEEDEAKRQDAMHPDPPGAAEYLGDAFPF